MGGWKGSGNRPRNWFTGINSRWQASGFDIRSVPDCIAAAGILGGIFYRSILAAVLLLPVGVIYARQQQKERKRRKQRVLASQFRDALESVITAMKAGDSPENAFRTGRKDMEFQYGREGLITQELAVIENGLENRVPLEQLLEAFAGRWEVEELMEFAEIFAIVKRSGGNMTEILSRTSDLLQERIEVEEEIQILLGNRRMERKIMDLTPFLLVLYISLTSPGFFDVLYGNLSGAAFMTACLVGYVAAYALSEKILDIPL